MPKIRPNSQLKQIVLQETNEGRDVVRYLKSIIVDIEGAPQLYGLRAKDYARSHKIAAARILARIGLEEGKRYLRRNYVQTPFKRVHPEDEDIPGRDTAASTAELYRLVKKETNDGRDIIIRFVEIMKGCHPEYKPHLRMAAAKELIRQIEFDYDDEPTPPAPTRTEFASPSEPVGASLVGAHDPQPAATDSQITTHHQNHTNHSSDTATGQPNPENPTHPENPASDNPEITAHHQNHTNHSSDNAPNQPNHTNHSSDTTDPIDNSPPRPHHEYASEHCAPEEESIYRSIIRRAAERPNIDSAKTEAERLIEEFNRFAGERNPKHRVVVVPDDLLSRSLTQRMEDPGSYVFDPADYYDLDRDDFYFCLCRGCDECDELEFYIEFIEELEEETNYLLEDP